MKVTRFIFSALLCSTALGQPLPGTDPLRMEGDITSTMIDRVDGFLIRQIDEAQNASDTSWNTDDLKTKRARLGHLLGVRDERVVLDSLDIDATTNGSGVLSAFGDHEVLAVSWDAFADVRGYGLLIRPKSKPIRGSIIVVPDCECTPEQAVSGVSPTGKKSASSGLALQFVSEGCQVLIPALIDRSMNRRDRRTDVTNREFVYRGAFEMGRHVIGYELQKIFTVVEWFRKTSPDAPIGIFGHGEGGMLALYAGALDDRIQSVGVSGYFENRRRIWDEPLDRNVFHRISEFGDAELASMILPRRLTVELAPIDEAEFRSKRGGPGTLKTPQAVSVREALERLKRFTKPITDSPTGLHIIKDAERVASDEAVSRFMSALGRTRSAGPDKVAINVTVQSVEARQQKMVYEMNRHTQNLLRWSPYVRQAFMKKLKTNSMESFAESVAWYRDYFRTEIIGEFAIERLAPKPRTRKYMETADWTAHEVVLDVFDGVFAYGIIVVPKNIKGGERRPVVVCQHGLEGRPQQVISGDHRAYHDFAAKLAERGFVTFAPQNIYIFKDRFRTLQRKANAIGKTLFSIMIPQHRQITDWLASLPYVDPDRIGFYGLSYGGKSAMRIPPLVDRYCLSICSADFNDWIWKIVSTRPGYSYMWASEYEIFEFDLGNTFNYSDMAALIAPRPFMVERGHFDGVAPDRRVGYEFANVRHLYQAKLGIGDRCEIEWFPGPHTINGQGTFEFLHKHLRWPKPK